MSQGAAADPNLAARQRPDAPLGTLIFRAGLVPADALEEALEEGIKRGRRLGEILIERGLINETDLARILAGQKGLTYVDPTERYPDPDALALLSEEKAKLYRALPLGFEDGAPLVAITDPTNDTVINEVTDAIGREPRFAVAARSELVEAISRAYGSAGGEGSGPAGGLRLAEPAVAVEAAAAAEHDPVVEHQPEVAGPHGEDELPVAPTPEIAPLDVAPTPEATEQPPTPSLPEPAAADEPEPTSAEEPATEAEPMFAPHLLRTEPEERRPAFAPEPAPELEERLAPEPPTSEPMFAIRVEPTVEAKDEPEPAQEPLPPVAPAVQTAGSAPLVEDPSGTEPEAQSTVQPEPEHQPEPAAEPPAMFSSPAPAAVAEPPVAFDTPAEHAVVVSQPDASNPEPIDNPLDAEVADPIRVARPEPEPDPDPSPPPAAQAVSEPQPTTTPPETTPCSVVLRLADGERVELISAESEDTAWEHARAFIRQLADADSSEWPIVAGRFVRPDSIVSIEISDLGSGG